MEIQEALRPISREQLSTLTRSELIELLLGEQEIRAQLEQMTRQLKDLEEETLLIGERYIRIKTKAFTPSSERKKRRRSNSTTPKAAAQGTDRKLLPSERYPDADLVEQDVEIFPLPPCDACGAEMVDSGMSEISESLSVIPKNYLIKRQYLHKYCCKSCHGNIVTAPSPERIKPGSSYDDEMIIDVSLSKYCDLIPVERYAAMAARQGVVGLPANSLIELTHYLAEFLQSVYELIRQEVQASEVLHADETPHKMLEGSEKSNWYLWGFSNERASYFECHPTRSGDIAAKFLAGSNCSYLMSDVYSGYVKAVREANELRRSSENDEIVPVYCNAHARRKLREIEGDDGDFFVEQYARIYTIDAEVRELDSDDRAEKRAEMAKHFAAIKKRAEPLLEGYSTRSLTYQSANYFLKNYDGLTRCISNPEIPLDNNRQERQLRNPVVGRKTWYGTHSERGARTAQILFSIVESCKLNHINPRQYIRDTVTLIHQGQQPLTPYQTTIRNIYQETG